LGPFDGHVERSVSPRVFRVILIPGVAFGVLGFRVSGFGFRVSGFGFRVFWLSDFGCFGFWVEGFGFRVSGLLLGVEGAVLLDVVFDFCFLLQGSVSVL